jgi:hypothetical protein
MSDLELDPPRINLRAIRVQQLVSMVLRSVSSHAPEIVHRQLMNIGAELTDEFEKNGLEVLSDYQRQLMKLPKRGPDGWTVEEIIRWDNYRMELMTRPISLSEPLIEEPPFPIASLFPAEQKES